MRILLIVTLMAAAGWSGFWWIGANGVENGLRDWLDARADDGWLAEYESVETQGFPNRFDTKITALDLADPATGIAITAPFLLLHRLSYAPDHLIAVWPPEHSVASPHQRITVRSDDARASLLFKSGTDHELDRASLVANDIQLDSTASWSADLAELRLATRPSERLAGGIDLALNLKDLRPENAVLAKFARAGLLPDRLSTVYADAALAFDAPWDRRAIESRRPALTAIELNLAQATWGQLELWLAGDLTIDSAGRASGSITVKAKNWREILQLGTALGWVPASFATTLESGLALLASLSGDPMTLDAPLTFTRGQVSFGPIPLGKLPPLILR